MSRTIMCSKDNLEKNLSDKIYIVTGTTSGIGLETVTQLAKQSATVICAARNIDLSKTIINNIKEETKNDKISFLHLDLNSLQSVRVFIKQFNDKFSRLDGLVNNAGVMHTRKQKTVDGFELQFGVNYLSHFLLTELLIPKLKKSKDSRIIHTSSVMHERTLVDLDDLNYEKRKYSRIDAYNQSKLAQVLYARYQATLLKKSNITSVSLHPGWVQTPLIKHTLPVFFQDVLLKPFLTMAGMINVKLGTQTTLHCLIDPSVTSYSGYYFSQFGIYKDKKSRAGGWPMKSPNSQVYDDLTCKKLYEKSLEMVGLKK